MPTVSLYDLLCRLDDQTYFAFTHDFAGLQGYPGFETQIASASKPLVKLGYGQRPDIKLVDLLQLCSKREHAVFTFLSYELKNRIDSLKTNSRSLLSDFPDMLAFEDEGIQDQPVNDFELNCKINNLSMINFIQSLSKEEYIDKVNEIKELIREGEVYELNFCMNFHAYEVKIDPLELFCRLVKTSPMPFAGLYKLNDQYILSASPERFISYNGKTVFSQPIKGTLSEFSVKNKAEAESRLRNSEKEIAENLMIVDLVRNDLNRICKPGSVKVDELFGVYHFPGLYHMISTVSGLPSDLHEALNCIWSSFPMGSMTGAPKISAMKWIDRMETHARGPFSGSIGYIKPNGSFDFNVLIRSLFYDRKSELLSYSAGSAITIDSDPEHEYEECLLKAERINRLLKNFA